ncbi:MAG: hypothetical protein JWP89_6644 [Schlesneria sp.]|nr:hypothetical protein [Schlesneria sp.]
MEFQEYFTDDVSSSWDRCFSIWSQAGRVEDLPHGVRMSRYQPSLGKRLGQKFADLFCDETDFLIQKLRDRDPVISLCAFDLIEEVFRVFQTREETPPAAFLELNDPIPAIARTSISIGVLRQTKWGRS